MTNIQITYFAHGSTPDNEKEIATGWGDPDLSELGRKQALQLKEMTKGQKFDAVFSSDLKRAVETAKIVFGAAIPDKRLRECHYGDLEGKPSMIIDAEILKRIKIPFPNGESYADVEKRMRSFLSDLQKNYSGKKVAIVAHRAPQLALDMILSGKSWEQAVKEDWRLKETKEWEPGWNYALKP